MRRSETTLTQPRPVREELEELSRTIQAERERVTARPGDTAVDCAKYDAKQEACVCGVPAWAGTYGGVYRGRLPRQPCPDYCPCFRRRP